MSSFARLILVRHAPTEATRRHAFPRDEPLDVAGEAAAAGLRGRLEAGRAVTAPLRRCSGTAALAGFEDAESDARWSELDFGAWAGATLGEIGEREPDRVQAWLDDPQTAPPGGEALADLTARVRDALDEYGGPGADTVVFTSGGPVKAAVVAALGAPDSAFWRIDVDPCSATVLHCRSGRWTVRSLNADPRAGRR
ncbi:histidine phosphatase family protein [Glycomyces sp. TRM65418]|uniref:histidine phosphatase family protein n=1 Tax=Glycomyces sp. TRM65418 TaxID=2867006 RepID=UPI001CE56F79|nr:histidine phosphatase family protein [Glycomyces sp. TRM65418]MCC3764554.1 histidine phosphatase family protein [Glycomyces sp. TRM65418]QZD54221.1 histidine phosphatase family protein [Glycomyces sp. TRM65418]